jgi:type IV secretory pathway TraG/TraD family ATPase VirD4
MEALMGAIIIFAILFVVIAAFNAAGEGRERKERADKAFEFAPQQLLGGATFASDKDCKAAGLMTSKGIPCGYSPEKGKQLRYNGDAMAITVAPVGSGKGTCQIVPACLSMDDRTLIVVGSKSEIPAIVSSHRAKLAPAMSSLPTAARFLEQRAQSEYPLE